MTKLRRLERTQQIQQPIGDVFSFFARAENLQPMTPKFLNFRILTPLPIEMCAGARIEYALSLFGVPMRWRTLISEWEPSSYFVDEQESGPFKQWVHRHEFRELANGATEMRDTVDYAAPLGPLGAIAHPLMVDRTVRRIFDHRAAVVEELVAEATHPPGAVRHG